MIPLFWRFLIKMEMVRVWAIIGDANSGKSTMIGHLTSHFGATDNGLKSGRADRFCNVLLRGGGLRRVWSRRMAFQEAGLDPSAAADMILERQNQDKPLNILISLRHSSHNGFPGAETYLSSFLKRGWSLSSLVLMGPTPDIDTYLEFGSPTLAVWPRQFLDKSENIEEIGLRVGQIRNHFGWA